MTILLYSPVDRGAHSMLMDALAENLERNDVPVVQCRHGIRGLADVVRSLGTRRRTLYVQTAGLLSPAAMIANKLTGGDTVYYMHEPHSLRTKIERGNGRLKSTVWHLAQVLDYRLADTVLVSRPEFEEKCRRALGRTSARFHIAGLILPTDAAEAATNPSRITYIGRLDQRRYLDTFLDEAAWFQKLGFVPTILTSDDPSAVLEHPGAASVEVVHEPGFTEERKSEILHESALIWNPKQFDISQSGVTAESLRFGVRIVLRSTDPDFERLERLGLVVDFDSMFHDRDRLIETLRAPVERRPVADAFSRHHGAIAFDQSYLPVFAPAAQLVVA